MPSSDKIVARVADKIIFWLNRQLAGAKKEGFVIGLIGGVDSAVTALLARRAAPVLAMILPCESGSRFVRLAGGFAARFDIPCRKVDLAGIYRRLLKDYNGGKNLPGERVPQANLKARLRMITLYYFANKYNYLVLGTGNKTELSIGYFTKYGDGGADLLPIGNLYKKDVYRLARFLEVPTAIIRQPPSAGLWPGQTDEAELGISYKILDGILQLQENKKPLPRRWRKYWPFIRARMLLTRHKLRVAPVCPISMRGPA
jgi:NAD+ synthase